MLEGDGYDVVAEASTPAELARVLVDHRPDVVVIDDSIGATAPQVVREVSPGSKVVVVWPGAVVPIGGDARVEPSQVLRQLGPTVAKVSAGIAGVVSIERPEWVEKVRKDPATLREMLERRGGLPTTRPSVTELQRRGQRLHPTPSTPGPEREDDDTVAPVLPIAAVTAAGAAALVGEATIELPETPEAGGPVLHLPEDEAETTAAVGGAAVVPIAAAAGGAATAARLADAEATELNRRLGTIALGGAAVIGAVVFALAVGGSRLPTDIIVAEGPRATIAPGPPIDSGLDHPPTPDPGVEPPVVEPPAEPDGAAEGPGPAPSTYPPSPDGGNPPPSGGTEPPPPVPRAARATPPVPSGGTEPPPPVPSGGTEPPPPGAGGGGAPPARAPGKSAAHNPHGLPPGQATDPTVGPGGGANGGVGPAGGPANGGEPAGNGARHWEDGLPGQAGQHGQGIEHGLGLQKLSQRHEM